MKERIEFTCSKEMKQDLRSAADRKDISIAAYTKNALFEQMKRDQEVSK